MPLRAPQGDPRAAFEDKKPEAAARPMDMTNLFADEERRWKRELLPEAIAITILVHVLFLLWVWFGPPVLSVDPNQKKEQIPIEITLQPAPPVTPPMQLVETNPLAPVPAKAPDTQNTSDRDQVSAQPKPLPKDEGRTSTVDKGTLKDSQKIVQGSPMTEPPAPPAGSPKPPAAAQTGKATEDAAPATQPAKPVKLEESPDGYKQPTEKTSPHAGVENSPPPAPQGDPSPLPRPQLQIPRPPGPLRESVGGVSSLGAIAIDAKFSEFGAYQQRMMEAISLQWNMLASRFNFTSRDVGTFVQISFTMDKDGNLSDFTIEQTSASNAATLLCQDAVISRAPFGPWTQQMVKMLGEKTPVRIRFYYQ